MRKLSLLTLFSVWMALPSSAQEASFGDIISDLLLRADVVSVVQGVLADDAPGRPVHKTTITLTDGTILIGVGETVQLATRDVADIYYNQVAELEVDAGE